MGQIVALILVTQTWCLSYGSYIRLCDFSCVRTNNHRTERRLTNVMGEGPPNIAGMAPNFQGPSLSLNAWILINGITKHLAPTFLRNRAPKTSDSYDNQPSSVAIIVTNFMAAIRTTSRLVRTLKGKPIHYNPLTTFAYASASTIIVPLSYLRYGS